MSTPARTPRQPLTLRLVDAADLLGYSPSTFRRLVAAGALPGPIDPTLSPKLRRWSRPLLERYAAGAPVVTGLRVVS